MKPQLKNLNMGELLKNKIIVLLCIVGLSGCVGGIPSTLEVVVNSGKIAYNKCSDLDNWQCLWYDY